MKRSTLSLLCLLLALCLGGCGVILFPTETSTSTTTSTIPPATIPDVDAPTDREARATALREAELAALGAYDFEGATFVIATTTPERYEGTGSEHEDVISAVAYERNLFLQSKYHVWVTSKVFASAEVMFQEVRVADRAGIYLADLFSIPFGDVGTYVAHDLLSGINQLPYVDTSAPYFHSSFSEASTFGTDVYAVCGDANLTPEQYPCVLFQTDVFRYLEIDPYTYLTSNRWTWDTFFTLCNTATAAGFTGYTYACSDALLPLFPQLVLRSAGNTPVSVSRWDAPALEYGAKNLRPCLELLEKTASLSHTRQTSPDLFASGAVLFRFDTLSALEQYADLASGYGVMPLPKYSSMQGSYSSLPTADVQVFVTPATIVDTASTGRFLQYFQAASYGRADVAFTNDWLKNHLQNGTALRSVDSILHAIVRADFSDAFGAQRYDASTAAKGYETLAELLSLSVGTHFSAVWKGTVSAVETIELLQQDQNALQALLDDEFPFLVHP